MALTSKGGVVVTNRAITVYTTSWCHACHRVKRFLESHGTAYEEIDIDENPKAAELVVSLNDGRRSVPTLDIDGRFVSDPLLSEVSEMLLSVRARRAPGQAGAGSGWNPSAGDRRCSATSSPWSRGPAY